MDNKELAKHLRKEMQSQGYENTVFHLIKVPTESELRFWIQQYLVKDSCGHSEWSETFKRNIWIKDVDILS